MRKPFKYIGTPDLNQLADDRGFEPNDTKLKTEPEVWDRTIPDNNPSPESNSNLLILGAVAVGLFFLLKK